jgi:tRNA-intron endonuclease
MDGGLRTSRPSKANTRGAYPTIDTMSGELQGDSVLVADESEASQIYNRGYYGSPVSGGGLKLTLLEALYLVEGDRLQLTSRGRPVSHERLLRAANTAYPNFVISYVVYRDLRQRGYVVKENREPLDFMVYPRGGGPKKTPSLFWVAAISERAVFDMEVLIHQLRKVSSLRKKLLLAVVDEESDLTYYGVKEAFPRGKWQRAELGGRTEVFLTEDRATVVDGQQAQALYEEGFYGKMVGRRLQLSLIETVYLMKGGSLAVRNAKSGRMLTLESVLRKARRIQSDFDLRLRTYENLRERGIVVKTGFKYGSHFRAYEGDPEKHHAKYLIHAFPAGFKGMWPEISRAVRLAHGVKKEILFGEAGEKITYLKLQRIRP